MQIREEQVLDRTLEGVTLSYVEFTKDFADIKEYVLRKGRTIPGTTGEKESVKIPLDDILYFEAVGELVFAYTQGNVYEIKQRLYQLEEKLLTEKFYRASKSMLVSIYRILSVRPALNGRLYAKMENGEDVLISRNYAKQIAKSLTEEG